MTGNCSASRIPVVRIIARLNVGGPARHVALLSAGTKSRYPTLLVHGTVADGESDMSWHARNEGARLFCVSELGRKVHIFSDAVALWKLWRVLRRVRPIIVHTHTAKAGTLGRLAALFAGVPIRVHTFHGHVFQGYFGAVKTGVFVAIERVLARFTTKIVAISPRQRQDLCRYLRVSQDRVVVIPLGLDLDRVCVCDAADARKRFRDAVGADGALVFTSVGRLTAIKNQALSIRALALLPELLNNFLLVFVGGGEEQIALRQLAEELGVARSVRFAGWCHDLAAVYHGSDVVVLTSDNEGTPVCLIEALACGRPVVATNVGGVADVLENGNFGMLVPPGDVNAFAGAMQRLSDPKERAPYVDCARSLIRQRYGVSRLVTDVEALYDGLLNSK